MPKRRKVNDNGIEANLSPEEAEKQRISESLRRIFSPNPEEAEEDRRFLERMKFSRTLYKRGSRRFT